MNVHKKLIGDRMVVLLKNQSVSQSVSPSVRPSVRPSVPPSVSQFVAFYLLKFLVYLLVKALSYINMSCINPSYCHSAPPEKVKKKFKSATNKMFWYSKNGGVSFLLFAWDASYAQYMQLVHQRDNQVRIKLLVTHSQRFI